MAEYNSDPRFGIRSNASHHFLKIRPNRNFRNSMAFNDWCSECYTKLPIDWQCMTDLDNPEDRRFYLRSEDPLMDVIATLCIGDEAVIEKMDFHNAWGIFWWEIAHTSRNNG